MSKIFFYSNTITIAVFSICAFMGMSLQVHAMTQSESLMHMQGQLDTAKKTLTTLLSSVAPKGEVLGEATSQELQVQIDAIMKRIASLNQGKTQVQEVSTTASSTHVSSGLFKIVQKLKRMPIGQQDTPISKITIGKANEPRYLNEVIVRFVPANKNQNAIPWESFEEMSAWIASDKVLATDISDPSKWRAITSPNGVKMYEVVLFKGNQKLPSKVAISATLALSSTKDAKAKDLWTISVPKNGITVWTESKKHQKYGPSKLFTYVMVGDRPEQSKK